MIPTIDLGQYFGSIFRVNTSGQYFGSILRVNTSGQYFDFAPIRNDHSAYRISDRPSGQYSLSDASTVNLKFRNVSPVETLRERSHDFSCCRLKPKRPALQNFLVDLRDDRLRAHQQFLWKYAAMGGTAGSFPAGRLGLSRRQQRGQSGRCQGISLGRFIRVSGYSQRIGHSPPIYHENP